MTRSDLETTRPAFAFRRATRPLLIGAALCLLILFIGQWPQACNGVQVCPPLSLRPSTAAVWALIVGLTAVVASVVRVMTPAWVGRIAMGVLIALGVAGAVLTLLVTGF
jgi:hypothetical protein